MAIKANRYFNDPALAQAAQNIAGLFDAPSGSDFAGYANARAKNTETAQRSELWRLAQAAGDQDRMGVIADLYDPSQSYYAVDADTASKRYGYDTAAATQRANNAADNARLLATNKSDNLAKLYTEGYNNVGQGETQPAMPLSVLSQFGGTAAVPEFKGQPKPLTEAEVKGSILQQMDAPQQEMSVLGTDVVPIKNADGTVSYVTRAQAAMNGQTPVLSKEQEQGSLLADLVGRQNDQAAADELIKQSVLGTDVVQTVGPDSKPVYTPRYDASGKTAADTTPGSVENYTATGADGKPYSFAGYVGPDNKVYDVNSTKPVPNVTSKQSGQQTVSVTTDKDGNVTTTIGPAGGAGGKSTEAQQRAGYAGEMSQQAVNDLTAAFDSGQLPEQKDYYLQQSINAALQADNPAYKALIPLLTQQMSAQGQIFYQNLRTALPYQLMAQSGQAVTEQEYERKLSELMPVPGEDAKVTAAKKRQLGVYLVAVKNAAGAAGANIVLPGEAAGSPAGAQAPAPVSQPAQPAAAAPAATAGPAAPNPAGEAPDRAASIANAKVAIASGKPRAAIEAKLKTAFPDFDPKELD